MPTLSPDHWPERLAVAHDQFKDLGVPAIRRFGHNGALLYDVKHLFPADQVDGRL